MSERPHLSRRLMAVLALLVFSASGTIHFQTPLLGRIGAEFRAGPTATGWIATLTFAGFFAGTLLLVPLGDRYDKRRLILIQTSLLAVAMLAMAAAPTLTLAAVASFMIGLFCGISQHIVPLVSELAPPAERGRYVGTMLSSVFTGLLYARLMSGQVGEHLGWRWSYVIGATLIAVVGCAVAVVLPRVPPKAAITYVELLRSVGQLYVRQRRIRQPAAVQFFLGLCYGGFWATIAGMLLALHGLGPAVTGLIGLSGLAGILVARPAGRWMDRRGVAPVVSAGIIGVVLAYVTLVFAGVSVAFVVVGAALLDCGLRAAMVANQTLVTSAVPDARSRSMTIFTAHMWGGNAVGAFIASAAFTQWGWPGVCAIGITSSLTALLLARLTNGPAAARR